MFMRHVLLMVMVDMAYVDCLNNVRVLIGRKRQLDQDGGDQVRRKRRRFWMARQSVSII